MDLFFLFFLHYYKLTDRIILDSTQMQCLGFMSQFRMFILLLVKLVFYSMLGLEQVLSARYHLGVKCNKCSCHGGRQLTQRL